MAERDAVPLAEGADEVFAEGMRLLQERNLPGATAAFTMAERLGADADACGGGRWEAAMLRGEMEAAWQETDRLRARGRADPHRFWSGEAPAGKKVVIRCLHGFGDTIQMLPYVARLLATAARVVLEVPPELLELIEALPLAGTKGLQVVTWGAGRPRVEPEWEMQVEVTELPYLFRTQTRALPLARRYLQLATAETEAMDGRMGVRTRPRVGVVWSAGEWNVTRAVPAAMFAGMLRLPMEFWSLVHARHWEEAVEAGLADRLRDAAALGTGIRPMAAVIANLDLLITTDTLAAHLAGAMGVQVWVLLPFAADWRWMDGREDSPWYPSMRLIRQERPGEWAPVMARAEAMLRAEGDL